MSTDDDSARENGQWQVPGGQPANPGYQPPAGYPLGANSRPPAPSFPAAPLGSTPTPRPSPIERLRDTRGATGGKRATAHPDGAPSPIPRASALKANTPRTTGAAAAGTQVVQRFSGTGLTPRPVVARREDRARRATLVLASAAVLLLVVSALALFDPTSHFAGFGFALGQRVTQVKSDVPLILQGTEPPTPTLGVSTASPTATPNNGGGPDATATPTGGPQPTATAQATATAQPTATPQATATPVPTSTPLPTATPTVLPTGATVTFNATKQNVNANPTYTACPSGCDFGSRNTSGQINGSYFKQYVSGYQSQQLGGPLNLTLIGLRHCYVNTGACSGGGIWTGAGVKFTGGGLSANCGAYVPGMGLNQSTTVSGGCYQNTYNSSTSVSGRNAGTNPDPNDSNIIYVATFNWSANWSVGNGNSTRGYYYPTQSDCNTAVANAYNNARGQAQNAVNSFLSGYPAGTSNIYQNNGANSCSPGVGQPGGSVTGYTAAIYSAETFDPNAAVNAAKSRIGGMLPGGYLWSSGPTTCSASSLLNSGNYHLSGSTYTITCPASGTATYDWGSSSQGQTAQTNLKAKLAGQSLSAAQSICNGNYPGVSPGSCTITLTGGNVSILPGTALITIVAN